MNFVLNLTFLWNTIIAHVVNTQEVILDSGPLYHEFHADAFIKEPWNAFSSLFFLVPVFYWVWRLRGQYWQYPMIALLLPLLFLNGVGSTVYHAFRASELALLLDWLPAFAMNLILAWYMWKKVVGKSFLSGLIVLGFILLAMVVTMSLFAVLGDLAANIGYLFIGLSILIPSIIFLVKTKFYKGYLLVLTFIFLGIALLFRSLDYPTPNPFPDFLPQGTHFLWHITSALAVFTLGFYFMHVRDIVLKKRKFSYVLINK